MLFVESLVDRPSDHATVTATLPDSGIAISNGTLLPEYFIELIAQATAIAKGYDSLCDGQPMNDGMLVGIDSFSFLGNGVPGRKVRIETEKTFEFGPVKVIHGEVYDEETLLARGDIKVWEDLGPDVKA